MSSILPTEKGRCFVCGRYGTTEYHHIFGAANRKRADKDGLTAYLCPDCHRRAHSDYELNVALKRIAEQAWTERYMKSIEAFIGEYGKNYIW